MLLISLVVALWAEMKLSGISFFVSFTLVVFFCTAKGGTAVTGVLILGASVFGNSALGASVFGFRKLAICGEGLLDDDFGFSFAAFGSSLTGLVSATAGASATGSVSATAGASATGSTSATAGASATDSAFSTTGASTMGLASILALTGFNISSGTDFDITSSDTDFFVFVLFRIEAVFFAVLILAAVLFVVFFFWVLGLGVTRFSSVSSIFSSIFSE